MDLKNKIEKKIFALLQKTTENGATQAEAVTAMMKAKELCEMYAVEISDIKEPMQGETLTVRNIPVFKSGYDFKGILYWLKNYFDLRLLIFGKKLKVFGYNTDIDLFEYFYDFVCKSCLKDLEEYKRSASYQRYKIEGINGRTIAANYIKGYLMSVSLKLKSDYNQRKEERETSTAVVLYEKEKAVQDFYEDKTRDSRIVTHRPRSAAGRKGYEDGKTDGQNVSLIKGVNQ